VYEDSDDIVEVADKAGSVVEHLVEKLRWVLFVFGHSVYVAPVISWGEIFHSLCSALVTQYM
jgi:hypothetical protein